MELSLDSLIKEAKDSATVSSYIRLFQAYKSLQKYFSAEQTLERCLISVKFFDTSPVSSEFTEMLQSIIKEHEDIKPVPLLLNADFYLIYTFLGDICLVLKKPLEAISWLVNAVRLYSSTDLINQRLLANVVYSGLLQCFLSIMLQFLYEKEYKKALNWKQHLNWLINHIKSAPEYQYSMEKLELMIANYYFILYAWYGNVEDFEACENHAEKLDNNEVRFIISYYRDKSEAKRILRDLVMAEPGVSVYWAWMALVEEEYSRKINAINRALQIDKHNWPAWVTLGIVQASKGDFMAAANTWKIAHHFNHSEPKLWLLCAFLYKEAKNSKKSIESFKMACDLDPSAWITIESYLSG